MKLIHCADLHLDSKMSANLTKEQAKERKNELLRTFVHMVDYAKQNDVYGILISGDLFDTRTVSATTKNVVKGEIETHPEIQFFYLKGNHDDDSFVSKLDTVPENLHLFSDEWTKYTHNGVTIAGLELSEENLATRYHSLVLSYDEYNVVMLHGQLAGYQTKDKAEIISLDDLAFKNIDYLALGHIHSMQTGTIGTDKRGMYAYPGCLEGRGFDECGEKGFILLDIDEQTQTAEYRFVPIASRTIYELHVDVTGIANSNEAARKIEAAINENQYSNRSLVKIVLTGELDVECEINTEYLAELFTEYFYYLKVVDETTLLIRYQDYEKDESLKGEFVRTVMRSDMTEEQKTEVIRCGILALSGEDF